MNFENQWLLQAYQLNNINIQYTAWNAQYNCNQLSFNSVNRLNYPLYIPNNTVKLQQYQISSNQKKKKKEKKQYQRTSTLNNSFQAIAPEQTKMNEELYCKDYYNINRFGDFAVHFANSCAIPSETVEKIFSEFGQIASFKQTGDKYGLCFVNFETEDAAKKCVLGLKDHPKIKLRQSKFYSANKFNNNNNNNNNNSSKNNDRSSSSLSGPYCSTDNKENYKSPSEDEYKKSCHSQHESEKNDDFSNNNNIKEIPNSASVWDDNTKEEIYSQKSVNNIDEYVKNMNRLPEKKIDTISEPCFKSNLTNIELPELIPAPKKTILNDVCKLKINEPKKPVEIDAEEIVVANIQENYGVPAILHLLEKYEPICASPIMITKSHSIRYCHVYFTDKDQAEAAERDFDQYEWSENNKLIVMKVDSLALLASKI